VQLIPLARLQLLPANAFGWLCFGELSPKHHESFEKIVRTRLVPMSEFNHPHEKSAGVPGHDFDAVHI